MANKSKVSGKSDPKPVRPKQSQSKQPGTQKEMRPQPENLPTDWRGAGLLEGRVALITGGDSGIGRAVAVAFAREGASLAIAYLNEDDDAETTKGLIEAEGQSCLLIRGDISNAKFCHEAVQRTIDEWGRLDCLVNNAAEQHPREKIEEIEDRTLEQTFRTNIFSMFYLTRAAVGHLEKQPGSSIINTTSVTAYRGSAGLLDYSATKGAIVSFTRSLSQQLIKRNIRVNAVAPGPIWTPLIPATFSEERVEMFGSDAPLGRAGHAWEVAGAYVFLASERASYITGQVIHPNGGEIING